MKNGDSETNSQTSEAMRQSLELKRSDVDLIIKEILAGGDKTANELRDEIVSKRKMCSRSTFYKHLKKLVRRGEILEHNYRLVKIGKDADPEEVEDCVKTILNTEEYEEVIKDRIRQLRMISRNKRTAHLPKVLDAFEKCLENLNVIDDLKAVEELSFTLNNILRFERKYNLSSYKKIIKRIMDGVFKKILSIVEKRPDFLQIQTILFLGNSWSREAVDIFFRKIEAKELDENQINNIEYALKELYRKNQRLINKYIDNLLRSDDEQNRRIAKKLREGLFKI